MKLAASVLFDCFRPRQNCPLPTAYSIFSNRPSVFRKIRQDCDGANRYPSSINLSKETSNFVSRKERRPGV